MEHFTLYQHEKRPEWGLAIAIDHLVDRKTYLFEGGERRTFMNEYVHFMSEVEPEEEAAAKARRYFDKHAARAIAATPAKKKSSTRQASASSKRAKASAAASKTEPAAG